MKVISHCLEDSKNETGELIPPNSKTLYKGTVIKTVLVS